MVNAPRMLSPYRVLDLSDETGLFCGKVLADLGADVVKVERPGGDAARLIPPFAADEPGPDRGLFWLAYNTDKRSVTLNLESERGRDMLRQLVRSADFLVETYPPGRPAAMKLDYGSLAAINPRLVHVSITPFGHQGPYRDYRGSDLVAMAMGGMMSLVGEPHRPPLRVSVPQGPLWTGLYATGGALAAHYHRELTGTGQFVDVSLQSGVLWALGNAPAHTSTNGVEPRRAGTQLTGRSEKGATMRTLYRCKDGYINFTTYGGAAGRRSNQALVAWLAEEGLASEALLRKDWGEFDISQSTQQEIDEIEVPAAELYLRCTKAQFLEQGFRRGMLGYPVSDAGDILNDPQLEAREFWHQVDHPALDRTVRLPGPFAHFSGTEVGPRRCAPAAGEHNREVYGGELGMSDRDLEQLRDAGVI